MFHVKHAGPVYHFLAMWLTLPFFLILGQGCIQLARYPPVALAQPRPAAAAPPPASEHYDMRSSPAVNSLKILGFTAFKRMPYRSMAYKILETDSKSGSDYGLPFDHCHILNDNALSERRYIHRIKHTLCQSSATPAFHRLSTIEIDVANLQQLAKSTTRYPQVFQAAWTIVDNSASASNIYNRFIYDNYVGIR